MYIIVLLAFMAVFSVPPLREEGHSWPVNAIAAGSYILVATVIGLADRRFSRKPGGVNLRRHRRFSVIMRIWLVGALVCLLLLGLRERIKGGLHLAYVPLAGEIITIAPFLLCVMIMWVLEYPLHRDLRSDINRRFAEDDPDHLPCWSLGQYIAFNTRHQVLFIAVPVCLIVGITHTVALYVCPLFDEQWQGHVLTVLSLAAAIIVFVGAPLLVARIWKTSSLASGELRSELEQMCRDMKVKFRDILVWHSGGVLANAGAMGVIAGVRYLLISDAVLERMTPSEIRAIFGHELGHIRNHHILYMCLFVVGSIMISASLGVAAAITAGPVIPADPAVVEVTVMLTVLVSLWIFVFGHISRRFERQCDVFGAWVAGSGPGKKITPEGGEIFSRALEKVTELNGAGAQSRNWRHGRTAERMRYIYELSARGGSREECDLNVRKIKFTLWLGTAAGIAATVLIEVFVLNG